MVSLEEFVISEEAMEKLSNEEILAEHIAQGKPLQEIFGFTNEVVAEFYDTAKQVLEQDRYEEARNAFVFLTTINPYISDFWLGLGVAAQKMLDHDAALYAFSVAFKIDGRNIFPYILAAQCCIETYDYTMALDILEIAELLAEKTPEDQTSEKLKKDAQAAKEYVLQEQRRKVA